MWAKYLLSCCCMFRSLQFDMQHDHILKKFNFGICPTRTLRGSEPGLKTQLPSKGFVCINPLYVCKIMIKLLTIDLLVVAKFKYLTFDPVLLTRRLCKPFCPVVLSTGTGQSYPSNTITLGKYDVNYTKTIKLLHYYCFSNTKHK